VSAVSGQAGDRAQEHFLREFPPRAGRIAALYCALAGEVPTERIRRAYLAAGARLYYPRVTDEEPSPSTRIGRGRVGNGPYGIPEPSIRRASRRGCRGGTSSWSRASP